MAEMTSRGRPAGLPPQADPPRGDEALDDWFERRLEAQGILVPRRGLPVARIMAVSALVAAVVSFWWAAGAILTRDDSGPAATVAAQGGKPGTNGRGGKGKRITWRDVRLSVLNGYGKPGAASTVQRQLRSSGWTIGTVGNAGTSTPRTVVVFTSGFKRQARLAARKLQLGAPVPAAKAPNVPDSVAGVALVLGANGLPATT
jgi:hypothetical protein